MAQFLHCTVSPHSRHSTNAEIAAPVEQHHDLLVALQPLADFFHQLARQNFVLLGALKLRPHVEDFDLGQRPLLDALGQFHQPVLALLRVVIGLERRRGRAQHHHGIRHLGAHHRHIARVVARRLFLLVGVVVLLVDHDQRQVGHRRKHRRARAYHNVALAVADALPLLGALVVGERRVQDGDLVAEDLVQIGGHRRRQPDLRHQQNRRAPLGQHRLHGRQIHRRLARSGDAVQQHGQELAAHRPRRRSVRAPLSARG